MSPTESGSMPIGVDYDGKVYRDFTLRPLKVKDTMEVRRSDDFKRCETDDELMGLALLGRRLDIPGVPREVQTLSFMEEMFDDDLAEIMDAERRLGEAIARFRGEAPEKDNPLPSASSHTVGDGEGDEGRRSPGMAGSGSGTAEPGEGKDKDL